MSQQQEEQQEQLQEEEEQEAQEEDAKNETVMATLKQSVSQYVELLGKNRKFFFLWLSGIISITGNFLSNIAILTLVNQQTSSSSTNGIAVSAIMWCIFIPPMLLMPITGVISDLLDRRKVMLLSDFLRALIALLFLIVSISGKYYYLLYVFLSIMCALGAFFDPARESLIPVVVTDRNQVLTAQSISSLTWMLCTFVGSAMGGALNAAFGPTVNFVLDSLTFVASGVCVIMLLRYKELSPEALKAKAELSSVPSNTNSTSTTTTPTTPMEENVVEEEVECDQRLTYADQQQQQQQEQQEQQETQQEQQNNKYSIITHLITYFKELLSGIRFLKGHPYLLSICFLKFSGALSWAAIDIISLKYCDKLSKGKDGSAMFGIVKAVFGLASGLTPVVLERTVNYILRRRMIKRLQQQEQSSEQEDTSKSVQWNPNLTRIMFVCGFIAQTSGFALIYLSEFSHVSVFIIGHFILGCGGGTIWTLSSATIFTICPDEYMGRTLSFDMGFLNSLAQILSITFYGVIYDVMKLSSARMLALVAISVAALATIVWSIWAILTRNIQHIHPSQRSQTSVVVLTEGTEGG